MIRTLAPAIAALLLAAPALADSSFAADAAESRLRGCLIAGSSSAERSDLRAKVLEVRAFCGAQINVVRAQRVAAATRGLKGAAAEAAKAAAIRSLNDEIAVAIARFSGLTIDHA